MFAIGAIAATQTLAANSITRIVDTHTHFFDPNRENGVPWPTKGTSLYRPVYPKHWLEVAQPHGVTETVVVEASGWLEDNQWLLDVAAENKCVVGVVGNLDPLHTDFVRHIKRFGNNPVFRGVRISGAHAIQMDKPDFLEAVGLMADMGLEIDVNGPPTIHSSVEKLAKTIPSLRIVLNHVGIAGDAAQVTQSWRDSIRSLGRQPNVYCKISALTEQTEESNSNYGSAPRDVAYYEPILSHCWDSFGEDRLIYGSNWPVCEKGGTYADQFGIVQKYFASKGQLASEKYFWKNALAAYRWAE